MPRRLFAGRRSTRCRPLLERLEARWVPSTFSVTSTADSGPGSLRQVILDANKSADFAQISFDIGPAIQTIRPTVALPSITRPVSISGSSARFPDQVIVINGSLAGDCNGLVIEGGSSVVSNLVINGFSPARDITKGEGGLMLTSGGSNLVVGCKFGTDALGQTADPNSSGIEIVDSPDNTIGGTTAAQGNLISGNATWGVAIVGGASVGNVVEGNLIGTDPSGTKALGNLVGVLVTGDVGRTDVASANIIGGAAKGAGNVISGNGDDGVELFHSPLNVVLGNFIGTTASGSSQLGNGRTGITAIEAAGNTIGGTGAGAGNIICGNGGGSPLGSGDNRELSSGLTLAGGGSTSNVVQGNSIGIDVEGVIAPNAVNGVLLTSSLAGDGLSGGASNNTIGGADASARNVISGNDGDGVRIDAGSDNVIAGDWIGDSDLSGDFAAGNGRGGSGTGVTIVDSTGNTIGGTAESAGEAPGNLISGNSSDGILLGAGANDNVVLGNIIGLDSTGTFRTIGTSDFGNIGNGVHLVDAVDNTIGSGNVISNNNANGVLIQGADTSGNHVVGNKIGTDSLGLVGRGNKLAGVEVDGAPKNVIGDFGRGSIGSNLISANSVGVFIGGADAAGNLIQANLIGTNKDGTSTFPSGDVALSNLGEGIRIDEAPSNTIGGPVAGLGNLISNNGGNGLHISGQGANNTLVQGNFIGIDLNGLSAVPNRGDGVLLSDTADITIGGDELANGNVISGNPQNGIHLSGATTKGNLIKGNTIGLSADGRIPLGNQMDGIFLDDSPRNTIGAGALDASGNLLGANLIGGNILAGIRVQGTDATQNRIVGNFIGTDAGRTVQLGNGSGGIFVKDASQTVIGGDRSGEGNTIAYNGTTLKRRGFGVVVVTGDENSVRGNSIFNNAGRAIDLGNDSFNLNDFGDADTGPNNLQNYPVVTSVDFGDPNQGVEIVHWNLNSLPFQTYAIDVYDNTTPDPSGFGGAEHFEYSFDVTTDKDGNAPFAVPESLGERFVSATATDAAGNTSELSMVDTDADGLADTWETTGIDPNDDGKTHYLLPGSNPDHKDVYVEVDAMKGLAPISDASLGALLGNLQTGTDLDHVVAAFLKAPQALVQNPDGADGIDLHITVDDTNADDKLWIGDLNPFAFFDPFKAGTADPKAGFGTAAERSDPTGLSLKAKALAYRYCVFADRFASLDDNGVLDFTTSGVTRVSLPYGANDFMVTLGDPHWAVDPTKHLPYSLAEEQEGTFMHELGHTLGLSHGGQDSVNQKPNYYSIMNYEWQLPTPWMYEALTHVDSNYDGDTKDTTWRLDYSEKAYPTLDEAHLDETKIDGIGGESDAWFEYPSGSLQTVPLLGTPPLGAFHANFIDWNNNNRADLANQTADVNGDGKYNQLFGYDDWSHLKFDFRDTPTFANAAKGEDNANDELTFEEYQQIAGLVPPPTDPGTLEFSDANYDVNENSGSITIGVVRQGGTVGPVSIAYATSSGTATAGADYQGTSGVLTFADGQLSASITIPILDDKLAEAPESFTIALSNPIGGAVLGSQAIAAVTINDDEQPIPATFIVTNTEDAGPGSLRQAILDANDHLGIDTIAFAIGRGSIILPRSPLPPITDPVIIDGTTALGYQDRPSVQITGLLAGDGATGLDVQAGHSTIKGLVLDDFQTALVLGGGDNDVTGDWIGPNADGPVSLANRSMGIWIPPNSNGNTIGGATAAERNIVADNQASGILVDGSGNRVQGNWIGLDPTGLAALGNGVGMTITGASNTIGGTATGEGNFVSGNFVTGIDITSAGADGNVLEGNAIGADATGNGRVANQGDGILVENQAAGNIIGGTDAGAANVVAANFGAGIHLASASSGTNILGNTIDAFTSPDEDIFTGPGVLIEDSSHDLIGGTGPGAGNRITSDNNGVVLMSGTGSAIRGNAIFALSDRIGIDLGGDGPTDNDFQDKDTGPDNLQNFPVITSAALSGGVIVIQGDLSSAPSTTFHLDLYTSANSRQAGEVYLTTLSVTTDAAGNAHFSTNVLPSALTGFYITAIATDPGDNTSEFSDAFELDVDGDGVIDERESLANNNGDGNGDGIPDRFQPNVASLAAVVTFASPAGTQFHNVATASNPSPQDVPGRAIFFGGLFTWTLTGLTPGSATTVQLIVADAITFNAYYRYGPTPDLPLRHWDTFAFDGTTGAEVSGSHTLTLHLIDGGRGDDDLAPNGVIKELGGPVDGPEKFLVTNTNEAGAGSLRQAILDSNAHPATDIIAFQIGAGAQTIAPAHVLPDITNPAIIDGTTQPGYAGHPLIELSGVNNQDAAVVPQQFLDGLHITAGSATVRGLTIDRFPLAGIYLEGRAGNVIESNVLGPANFDGIFNEGSQHDQIGGTDGQSGNVIFGNQFAGIFLAGSAGDAVEGNIITQNGQAGVHPNAAGFGAGVYLFSTSGATVGGTSPGAGNVIASNTTGVLRDGDGAILGNSIHDNVFFGIQTSANFDDQDGDGFYRVTESHVGQPNFPILSSAAFVGANTVIQGRLSDRPDTTYRIELFSNSVFDRSGFGEGQTYLGAVSVTTDDSGNASFTATVPTVDSTQRFVTATATNADGDTSQFSARLTIGDVLGSVYVVNATDDADDGVADATHTSLREAIIAANNHPGLDTIRFDIGSGLRTIALLSNLPAIIDPVIIDATTQPGYQGTPLIELDGQLDVSLFTNPAAWKSVGLRFVAGNSTVRGLIINRFQTQLWMLGPEGNNIVQGCFIGTNASGTGAFAPPLSVDAFRSADLGIGIEVSDGSPGNLIGGLTTQARNVISGNFGFGIRIIDSPQNLVQGNLLGTDTTGARPIGNGLGPFRQSGISLERSDATVIGGTQLGARNVISFSHGFGLLMSDGSDNVVQGNFIGTDISGTAAFGNFEGGIWIDAFSQNPGNNQVGGSAPGAGNLISGNGGTGVRLDAESFGDTIQGNLIGTDVTGTKPLRNSGDGVLVSNQGLGNNVIPPPDLVGGTATGAANTIAFNTGRGVNVIAGSAITILGDSIFSNAMLGIDLGGDGVTRNDPDDTDAGANGLQNFPVLTRGVAGAVTHVAATLNSRPNATYTISFYASAAGDPSGFGQGQRYLGSTTVTTDTAGAAMIDLDLPAATTAGEVLSATATDSDGNTSEFSQDIPLQAGAAPAVQVLSVVVNDGAAQRSMVTSLTILFSGIVTLDGGAISVVQQGGTAVGVVLATRIENQQTVVEVTFTGAGVIAGSVADGRYDLTIDGNLVHDGAGRALDGNSDGTAGGNYVANNAFFRLFGDGNGDGVVDNRDVALFRGTFRKASTDPGFLPMFDFDGNGVVDINDQTAMMKRYGKRI